jgi:hypothetical protein
MLVVGIPTLIVGAIDLREQCPVAKLTFRF